MDQARRPSAGSGAEVALVDESGAEPAHRGVPGDAGPVDTGADDQYVNGVGGHGRKIFGPSCLRKGGVHAHVSSGTRPAAEHVV